MITFHDYDPAHPFAVTGETHAITDGKIILDYVPLQGSIRIDGFTAVQSKSELAHGAFFIDYREDDNYLSADGVLYFSPTDNGREITVDYQGVSTLLRASHMNEIKRFIETGASELAARILVTHEQMMFEKMAAWREGILAEMQGIRAELTATKTQLAELTAIKEQLANMKCCCKEADGINAAMIADDDEADALLDDYFPGSVTPTEKTKDIATDDEADNMLDEYFDTPDVLPGDGAKNTASIEDIATDEEFSEILNRILPAKLL